MYPSFFPEVRFLSSSFALLKSADSQVLGKSRSSTRFSRSLLYGILTLKSAPRAPEKKKKRIGSRLAARPGPAAAALLVFPKRTARLPTLGTHPLSTDNAPSHSRAECGRVAPTVFRGHKQLQYHARVEGQELDLADDYIQKIISLLRSRRCHAMPTAATTCSRRRPM